ncbi:MAG: PRC-barrel domain-containing protein [Candidatus Devosia phytovorans]|uniref:PRC-barrel domain-containing protein n=1 Tax=Candidatus Devosia phytovorans TaxID=3121372 RepID=A0AAJ5VSD0_9HYPH|nr:PRC-barrel domain-containing protein [Devosia sp.]WEK03235.1 MAG: PRC-barrel domain-containing protein [Devosia sp.]
MRTLVLAAAFLGFCASSSAQVPLAQVELKDPNANVAVLGITVEQAIGSDVIDTDGTPLGTVVRVLGDDADSPMTLVLSANGGEFNIALSATELINNRIVANRSGEPIEFEAPFE